VVEVAVIRVGLEAAPVSGQLNGGGLSVALKLLQVERDARRRLLAAGCGRGGLLGCSVDLRSTRQAVAAGSDDVSGKNMRSTGAIPTSQRAVTGMKSQRTCCSAPDTAMH
jgi:hypothetical protein